MRKPSPNSSSHALLGSKLDKRGEKVILLGYANNGYRILYNNKIIVARNIEFIDESIKYINLESSSDSENSCSDEENTEEVSQSEKDNESLEDDILDNAEPSVDEPHHSSPPKSNKKSPQKLPKNKTPKNSKIPPTDTPTGLRRSARPKKLNLDENFVYNPTTILVNYCNMMIPQSYEEAIKSEASDTWIEAMNKELKSFEENKTWVLTDLPKGVKPIDLKWIFKQKSDGSLRARLVAKGFQQHDIFQNTYSPVSKMQTLKILLTYCCKNDFHIEQMDVETAFLNSKVKGKVNVKLPPGQHSKSGKVYRVLRALYGLKDSPR